MSVTYSSDSHPNSWHSYCLEELHRRPVIIRPATISTLSSKSISFLVQLPHTTSPYSKTGLINATHIRIREYLSNKCLTCLSKNKREHAFLYTSSICFFHVAVDWNVILRWPWLSTSSISSPFIPKCSLSLLLNTIFFCFS
jgi:hypothetical protein